MEAEWRLPSTPKRPAVPVSPPKRRGAREERSEIADAESAVLARPVGTKSILTDQLAEALADLPALDAAATAETLRAARAKAALEQPWWVWISVDDSMRKFRTGVTGLGAWWRHWRTTASFRVLLAFVAIYALLAFMRKPSDLVVEQSLRAQDAEFLQGFLESYCRAGGAVLAARPHGGAEIFPRGVVLQGGMLEAFRHAAVGGVFTVRVKADLWNPLEAFYNYPSIYAREQYFQLTRKFDFSRYGFTFLLRKDSERAGAILLARVEVAP